MNVDRDSDKKLLLKLPKEKLADLLFLQLRNMWSVDGLYFIGIEERFGGKGATDVDRNVWEVMGKIEARRLRKIMGIQGDDIPTMMKALRISSWALDLEEKEIIIEEDRAILRNPSCRVQKTRLKKDLGEFPCKFVRWDYLKNFAKEFNENIDVSCNICPPGDHPENLWCEWEFIYKKEI
jgi:hypothetical protein